MLNCARLKELLSYDPETGMFTIYARHNWPERETPGRLGGGLRCPCYVIGIDYRDYLAHRVAWLYMTDQWPSKIDHIDHDRFNNKWSNLREATASQNLANRPAQTNNTSWFKGVSWSKQKQKWRAQICVMRTRKHLGVYATPEAAHMAYVTAAKAYFGEFARAQ